MLQPSTTSSNPDPVLEAIRGLTQTVTTLVDRVGTLEKNGSPLVPEVSDPSADGVAISHDAASEVGSTASAPSSPVARVSASDEGARAAGADTMATVQALRDNAELQRQVHNRLAELQQSPAFAEHGQHAHPVQGKRSGRTKTVHDTITSEIEWPQFHVQRAGSDSPPEYNDLSLTEFVSGTIFATLKEEKQIPESARLKLVHLADLMSDAADFHWPTLRQFHGLVMEDIETGKCTWANTDSIQTKKFKHIARSEALAATRANNTRSCASRNPSKIETRSNFRPEPERDNQHELNIPICPRFSQGICQEKPPHLGPNGRDSVKHACGFCSIHIRPFPHSEAVCRRKFSSMPPMQFSMPPKNA